jgi:hypothetical protein
MHLHHCFGWPCIQQMLPEQMMGMEACSRDAKYSYAVAESAP